MYPGGSSEHRRASADALRDERARTASLKLWTFGLQELKFLHPSFIRIANGGSLCRCGATRKRVTFVPLLPILKTGIYKSE